jgi:hypothetical protein
MTGMLGRSRLCGWAGCLAALVLATPTSGLAQSFPAAPPRTRFRSIVVDASILYARQDIVTADLLHDALEAELHSDFADRLGGSDARLVVRITGITLNAFAGGGRDSFSLGGGGGMNTDYLEGEALLVGPHGEVLARYPQLSAIPASSGGAWYLPGSDDRRVVALVKHFGGWLRRTIP